MAKDNKKIEAHKKAAQERLDQVAATKAIYKAGDGEAILADIKQKIITWQKLNTQIAQDGVGTRPTGHKLQDGTAEVENIYLTPVQRASYLDKNAGMQYILDYIDRQLA